MVEFQWFAGLTASQKQKSIRSLHDSAIARGLCDRPLEVSSKSPISTGIALSAFNLSGASPTTGRAYTVETAFQSSKVFDAGGPFRELLYGSSRDAKKDPRLLVSGRLEYFDYFGIRWELEPKTAFYDWLYINTLARNEELADEVTEYDAFTDIEFNPERSINCQAYSLALFKSLEARDLLNEALSSKEMFLEMAGYKSVSNACEDTSVQQRLI
jgi:hypothetical protein